MAPLEDPFFVLQFNWGMVYGVNAIREHTFAIYSFKAKFRLDCEGVPRHCI